MNDVVNLGGQLERVDVLGVVAQQLALELQFFNEHVRERRPELARVDLFGELEERPWIVLKVEYVEHGLWIGQVGKIDTQASVDAVARSKIRYSARHLYQQQKIKLI